MSNEDTSKDTSKDLLQQSDSTEAKPQDLGEDDLKEVVGGLQSTIGTTLSTTNKPVCISEL